MSRLFKMSIQNRLIFSLVGTAVVAAVLVSAFAYLTARNALTEAQFDKLTTIREHKAAQVEDYMATVRQQVESMAANPSVIAAMRDFNGGWDAVAADGPVRGDSAKLPGFYQTGFLARLPEKGLTADTFLPTSAIGRHLQGLYLVDNPNPVGSKHLLDAASDGSAYSAAHAEHHPFFRDFLERFGYYDIFLIEPGEGNIVYSVFKEVDYATSLVSGPYKDTNFASSFRMANAEMPGASHLVDFEPYTPSYGAPASFIAAPIYDGDQRLGVLVFQVPLARINQVMTNSAQWEASGLGKTGEAYLVGPDQKLRTESRFFIEAPAAFLTAAGNVVDEQIIADIERLDTTVGLLPIATEGVIASLRGETGTINHTDYRNESVLSSYRPLDIPELDWVILSEIDAAEAFAGVRSFRNQAMAGTAMVILLALGVAYFFGRTIARPITAATAKIRSLAAGRWDQERMETNGGGEMAQLAQAYNELVNGMEDLADRANHIAQGEIRESTGESTQNIANNGVLAEAFVSLESIQDRLASQAQLIARGDLQNPTLQDHIPGRLGESFADMTQNLSLLAGQARAIAAGDLVNESLQLRLEGDLGQSFQQMVASLQGLVGDIQINASSLSSTATQLHEAALTQQLGASEQASAVEETRRILTTLSSSAEEIASATSAVYTNAEVAQQTNQQTAEAIQELSGHTARIGEIVSFIKDIAHKSDLLALNAALEGTKAGEAGRSFGLVATQMQRLAEQIMGSLKDIDALTQDIRKATSSTVTAVEETARLSTQTTDSAGSIAEAIQEQKVGTQQSSTAMDQISAVAQKSVSASTDLVQASQQLQTLSSNFQRVIEHFTTEDEPLRRSA